jgi:hypothetical protein
MNEDRKCVENHMEPLQRQIGQCIDHFSSQSIDQTPTQDPAPLENVIFLCAKKEKIKVVSK